MIYHTIAVHGVAHAHADGGCKDAFVVDPDRSRKNIFVAHTLVLSLLC